MAQKLAGYTLAGADLLRRAMGKKIQSEMDIAENRLPQDGSMAITIGSKRLDIRVSTLPTKYGERIVMRILEKSHSVLGLNELGFSLPTQKTFEQIIQSPHGIFLVTGPTGSGKSTKLAEEAKKQASLVLTPTHKARNVLEAKGVENVFTIHAVLKLVPTLNTNFRKGQKLKALKRVGSVELDDIEVVIIDEFSMISTHILDLLLELLPDTCEVHIFGDPYR